MKTVAGKIIYAVSPVLVDLVDRNSRQVVGDQKINGMYADHADELARLNSDLDKKLQERKLLTPSTSEEDRLKLDNEIDAISAKILEVQKLNSAQEIPLVYKALCTVSAAASGYHGYKRNQSVGWAISWFLLGGIFPVITPVIAIAQGFGKEKDK